MKTIGILGNVNSDDQLWINRAYVGYFSNFGCTTIIDPFSPNVENIDLLVLPGGSDVSPARYGVPYYPTISLPNRAYEYFDEVMVPEYVKSKVPIFGICRGLQTLNVIFGGTLHPDIKEPTSYQDGSFVHFVKVLETNEVFECSSNHHQAIYKLANGFEVTAVGYSAVYTAKHNPVFNKDSAPLHIEGIRHITLPIRAVQFHPEKNWNGSSCLQVNEKFVAPQIEALLNYNG
jgi:putative glutamine amidotransferase